MGHHWLLLFFIITAKVWPNERCPSHGRCTLHGSWSRDILTSWRMVPWQNLKTKNAISFSWDGTEVITVDCWMSFAFKHWFYVFLSISLLSQIIKKLNMAQAKLILIILTSATSHKNNYNLILIQYLLLQSRSKLPCNPPFFSNMLRRTSCYFSFHLWLIMNHLLVLYHTIYTVSLCSNMHV